MLLCSLLGVVCLLVPPLLTATGLDLLVVLEDLFLGIILDLLDVFEDLFQGIILDLLDVFEELMP